MTIVDQQELARHLGISDRRVRQLEAELVISRLDGDPARYDLDVNARRYRLYANRDIDTVCDEILEATKDVEDVLKRLANEPDIQKRREIAKEDGGAIGRLDGAMKLATALQPEHSREMARTFNNLIIGRAAGDFFELCNWRLDISAEDFQPPVLQPQADIP